MTAVSVYCVFANAEEAERIARTAVEERLAACVNILGSCRSIYHWQGKVETATEAPAILKTSAHRTDALIARIVELHSYEVPAIAVWPIVKLPIDYAEWIEDCTR